MKWLVIGFGLLAILSVAGIAYVRFASHDPAEWHVDPVGVTEIAAINQHLDSAIIPRNAEAVAAELPDVLGGEV